MISIQTQEIVAAYARLKTPSAVARAMGADVAHVYRVGVQYGCIPYRPRTPHSLDRVRARQLYKSGCNDAEIARQLGVASATVRQWRLFNGLDRNDDLRPFQARNLEILAKSLFTKQSYEDIGAEYGLSRGAVAGRVFRAKRRLKSMAGGKAA